MGESATPPPTQPESRDVGLRWQRGTRTPARPGGGERGITNLSYTTRETEVGLKLTRYGSVWAAFTPHGAR
jgi:hypothetical protein